MNALQEMLRARLLEVAVNNDIHPKCIDHSLCIRRAIENAGKSDLIPKGLEQ